ncbi:MAG: class I SAM-dependent methyltransferase [Arenicella sp.]
MNDLEKYFRNNTNRSIHKWEHYFNIYDRHFSRFRGTDVHIVEFGVSQGGSLQMWKDYFGSKCQIYGVDINHHCKQFEEDQVQVLIGDQNDRSFLKSLVTKIPRVDILIDDGGHMMKEQINTFEVLFDHIQNDGVYLCEDLHTSYWSNFAGGYKKRKTFIEYSKNFIDDIHAWHSRTRKLKVSNFTKTAKSLHYYDSILVIEKGLVQKPSHSMTGTDSIPNYESKSTSGTVYTRFKSRIKQRIKHLINRDVS